MKSWLANSSHGTGLALVRCTRLEKGSFELAYNFSRTTSHPSTGSAIVRVFPYWSSLHIRLLTRNTFRARTSLTLIWLCRLRKGSTRTPCLFMPLDAYEFATIKKCRTIRNAKNAKIQIAGVAFGSSQMSLLGLVFGPPGWACQ